MGCCSSARSTVLGVAILHIFGSLGCIGLWSYLLTLEGPTLQKAASESWRLVTTLHLPVLIDTEGNVVTPAPEHAVRGREDLAVARNVDVVQVESPTTEESIAKDFPSNNNLDDAFAQAYVDYDNSSLKLDFNSSPDVERENLNYSAYSIAEQTDDSNEAVQEVNIIPIYGDQLLATEKKLQNSSLTKQQKNNLEEENFIPTEINNLENEIYESEFSDGNETALYDEEPDYDSIHDKNVLFSVELPEASITDLGSGEVDPSENESEDSSDRLEIRDYEGHDYSGDGELTHEESTLIPDKEESWITSTVENDGEDDTTDSMHGVVELATSLEDPIDEEAQLVTTASPELETSASEFEEMESNEVSTSDKSDEDILTSSRGPQTEDLNSEPEALPSPLPLVDDKMRYSLLQNNGSMSVNESNSTEESVNGTHDSLGITLPPFITTTGYLSTVFFETTQNTDPKEDPDLHNVLHQLSLSGIVLILLLFSCFCCLAAILMLVAALMKERCLMVPWLVIQWITVLAAIAGVGVLTWQLVVSEVLLWCWWLMVLSIAGAIVLILCLVLVMDAYQSISPQTLMDERLNSYEMEYMTGKTAF